MSVNVAIIEMGIEALIMAVAPSRLKNTKRTITAKNIPIRADCLTSFIAELT